MTVIEVDRDPAARTLTIVAEFDKSAERVWQVWADPRQLERWWGPPTHPATIVDHDLREGGRVTYYMTGPDGEKLHGGGESCRSTRRIRSLSRKETPTTAGRTMTRRPHPSRSESWRRPRRR